MNLLLYTYLFLLGLCAGSFLNVLICRLPRGGSLVSPPSHCPACGRRLGFRELLPLAGWLILKGRCRGCGVSISARYPLVELACGLLFMLIAWRGGFGPALAGRLFLFALLLAVSLIDIECRRVPNKLVLAGLAGGLLYRASLAGLAACGGDAPWPALADGLWGLLLGGGTLLLVSLASRGGMGLGDAKLMAVIGLFLGLRSAAAVLLLGVILGALTGIVLIAAGRKQRRDALPFAPFLSAAALLDLLWGAALWQGYLRLLGR